MLIPEISSLDIWNEALKKKVLLFILLGWGEALPRTRTRGRNFLSSCGAADLIQLSLKFKNFTSKLTLWINVLLQKLLFAFLVKVSRSQVRSGPYSEREESNLHPKHCFPKICYHIFLLSMPTSSEWCLPFRFPTKIFKHFSPSYARYIGCV